MFGSQTSPSWNHISTSESGLKAYAQEKGVCGSTEPLPFLTWVPVDTEAEQDDGFPVSQSCAGSWRTNFLTCRLGPPVSFSVKGEW